MTTKSNASRSGLYDLQLEPPLTHGSAHPDFLRTSALPSFQQSQARENRELEEMQKQDPLATQIWRFYTKTKQRLPAQERMENLTWRMMHLTLRRNRIAADAAKYVFNVVFVFPLNFVFYFLGGVLVSNVQRKVDDEGGERRVDHQTRRTEGEG